MEDDIRNDEYIEEEEQKDEIKEAIVQKKRGNFLFRQELKSYTPECNPTCAIIFNVFTMLIFLALGLPILVYSNSIQEYEINYTDWYVL